MNLSSADSNDGVSPLAPPEWSMEIGIDLSASMPLHYGEVFKSGVRMCRVSLATSALDDEAARRALANLARAWIDDYLSRPHSGDTVFPDV